MVHAHDFFFSPHCGASICSGCDLHAHLRADGTITQELARCYCGWNLAPGERLPDDVDEGDGFFDDGYWED